MKSASSLTAAALLAMSTLALSKPQVKSGQAVRMTFQVVNTSATNAAGTVVWNWAAPKRFSQNLVSLSLPPGKPFVYRAVWNGRDLSGHPVSPGAYVLQSHLTSNNFPFVTGGVIVNMDPDQSTWVKRPVPLPIPVPSARETPPPRCPPKRQSLSSKQRAKTED